MHYTVSDDAWRRLAPIVTRSCRAQRYAARDLLSAVLYALYHDCPWRKLPPSYPKPAAVYYYYRRWRRDGTLQLVLAELASYPPAATRLAA